MDEDPLRDCKEAARLLGWAEVNLTKGKTEEALTLIGKARDALDKHIKGRS